MIVTILPGAEEDLEQAFDYYKDLRPELGSALVEQFRRGVEKIQRFPNAWQLLDERYRRLRLNRFPYGIVYRVDSALEEAVIVAVMHLSQRPGWWKSRE